MSKLMMIKSLAELKRAISTPGVTITIVSHWQERSTRTSTRGSRAITANQASRRTAIISTDRALRTARSWRCGPRRQRPRAVRLRDDGTVTTFQRSIPQRSPRGSARAQ